MLGGLTSEKKTMLYVVGVLALCIVGYFVYSSVLYDNGRGADQVRDDIQRAEEQQRKVTVGLAGIESGLADSEKQAGRVSKTIGDASNAVGAAAGRIEQSQSRVDESARLISEGQSILAGIRARGQRPD